MTMRTLYLALAMLLVAAPAHALRQGLAGQFVSAQMATRADGTAITAGTVTVYIACDGGDQAAGAGTITSKGNGTWRYAPTAGEVDCNHIEFTFTHADGVNYLVQVWTRSTNDEWDSRHGTGP